MPAIKEEPDRTRTFAGKCGTTNHLEFRENMLFAEVKFTWGADVFDNGRFWVELDEKMVEEANMEFWVYVDSRTDTSTWSDPVTCESSRRE